MTDRTDLPPLPTNLSSISEVEARHAVARSLGLAPPDGIRAEEGHPRGDDLSELALSAATLRATLWARAWSAEGIRPVYVTRLLHDSLPLSVTSQGPRGHGRRVNEDEVNEFIGRGDALRTVLEELVTVGDIANLPRGYYLPAPLRLISLPAIARWMLVGGAPTHRLPSGVRQKLKHSGAARMLTSNPADLGLSLPFQAKDDWIRAPRQAIGAWAEEILGGAQLRKIDGIVNADESLYYAPAVPQVPNSRSNLQYYRWTPSVQVLPDNRYAVRRRSAIGLARYEIHEVRQGAIVASTSLDLSEVDFRRLLYGLDARATSPTTALVTRSGDACWYHLRNELPQAEYRLFSALGRLHLPEGGQYYPRLWEVARAYAAEIEQALVRLGVKQLEADTIINDRTERSNQVMRPRD